ncbi:MAG: anhydro-N-acetylmuramic acid kinase [Phycisphaeraceae bacterium]|nr:MAG: anhydro-N-acetylmuramic acid kinase [Phycisphaeraceae bacterium]
MSPSEAGEEPRIAVGCMSGTSLDGLDVAVLEIRGRGLGMVPRLVRGVSASLGPLGLVLRGIAEQRPMSAGEMALASFELGELHARAVVEALGGGRPELVCVHGQTVFHAPPVSWQMINPWPIVRATGAPVVFDLRGADVSRGGRGAPITPIADAVWLRGVPGAWAAVNLGGFCNVTVGRGGVVERAGDVSACNHVLDAVARVGMRVPHDEGGRRALASAPDPAIVGLFEGAMEGQRRGGRSLGTGDELAGVVGEALSSRDPGVVAASACEALGAVIARAVGGVGVFLAGGGANHAALVGSITRRVARAGGAVSMYDEAGLPARWREAACFAVLGALCRDGVAITLPSVTGVGAPAPLAGVWAYPASDAPRGGAPA